MTQADKWKKRPRVMRYRQYADDLRRLAPALTWEPLSLHFVLPMPKSWSKKKRTLMKNRPHTQKPDLDNLIKAFKDALLKEDSVVWIYGLMIKTWGDEGCIITNPRLRPVSRSQISPESDHQPQQVREHQKPE